MIAWQILDIRSCSAIVDAMAELYPCSPRHELDGLPYFPRLAEKVRLFAQGELHPELHDNLGKGMDLWICQFLGVHYEDLKKVILDGATDEAAYQWSQENGVARAEFEKAWFRSFILNRGFRDDMAEKLAQRVKESGFEGKAGIHSFCDYIDADEGRL